MATSPTSTSKPAKRRGRPPVWQTVEVNGEKVKVKADLSPADALTAAKAALAAKKQTAEKVADAAPAKPTRRRGRAAAKPAAKRLAREQGIEPKGARLFGVTDDGECRDLGAWGADLPATASLTDAVDAYQAANSAHYPHYLAVPQKFVWQVAGAIA